MRVHCDHTCTLARIMVGRSTVLSTLTPKDVGLYLLPAVFFRFHLEQRSGINVQGVISQERLKIEVRLLLRANKKSYMPRRLAQQRMTLGDLE